jgi:tRNA-modifying protein YgfZ
MELAADYRAALEGAAFVDEAAAGRMFLRGRDRAALLHRLSTNDIERLRPGQGTRTVLTTPIGRIIDLLSVHALDDDLLLLASPEQGPPVYRHIKSNIFFNDQVTIAPAGASHAQFALYGPAAPEVLATLGAPALAALALHESSQARLADVTSLVARRPGLGGQGFTIVVPGEGAPALRSALRAAGVVPLGSEAWDVLRVEHGYPAFGRELSQEYIPLETGLLDAVSFTKGCYVGQEIIARMESRGRLAKRLMGLRLSAPAVPARLAAGGKEAGDLTSAVVSPRFGPIALAYVRTAHAEPGTTIGLAGSDVSATIVELPFGH